MKERKLSAEDETNIMELQMYSKLLANARFTSKSLLIQAETKIHNSTTMKPSHLRVDVATLNNSVRTQDAGREIINSIQVSLFSFRFKL